MREFMFLLTSEQAADLCNYYDVNIDSLEDYEVCELLDRLIDDTIFSYK